MKNSKFFMENDEKVILFCKFYLQNAINYLTTIKFRKKSMKIPSSPVQIHVLGPPNVRALGQRRSGGIAASRHLENRWFIGDLPIKNGDVPSKKMWFSIEKMWFSIQKIVIYHRNNMIFHRKMVIFHSYGNVYQRVIFPVRPWFYNCQLHGWL